jgi:hypothetical protein
LLPTGTTMTWILLWLAASVIFLLGYVLGALIASARDKPAGRRLSAGGWRRDAA